VNDQMLILEIRILVLRHGKQKVLRALASVGDQTIQQIEQQLAAIENAKKAPRRKATALELATTECRDNPDVADALRALAVAFENRTFLPELRDVQRFLERRGSSRVKYRSRADAAPALIRGLAKIPREELLQLASQPAEASDSDYSLLARAIMGPRGKLNVK
jgi:hypothetical protein